MINKIVSGGQTGVDRAALDVARCWRNISVGGWIPKGRLTENGPLPSYYSDMKETDSEEYCYRTQQNVINSDGTLIIYWREIHNGTMLTLETAINTGRPYLALDVSGEVDYFQIAKIILFWVNNNKISVINIAGPRESECKHIYQKTYTLLQSVLAFQTELESQIKDKYFEVAKAQTDIFLANFRHWDLIRWLVPAWLMGCVVGLVTNYDDIKNITSLGMRGLFLLLSIFGVLSVVLQTRLAKYHNKSYEDYKKNINSMDILNDIKEKIIPIFPFDLKPKGFMKTASFGLIVASLLFTVLMLLGFAASFNIYQG